MSMTLEPDYFISGNGLPKLNSHKFYNKKYDKKSYRSKAENREHVCRSADEKAKRFFSIETRSYCDSKKLLSRRQNVATPNKLNSTGIDKDTSNCCYHCGDNKRPVMSDKELKSAINQQIKMCQRMWSRQQPEISNNCNTTLDNRLATSRQSYTNGILIEHETDSISLSSLDF